VLGTFAPLHIEPGRVTLASVVKKHGYQTAAIGKWHLGYGREDSTPNWRTDYRAELSPGPADIGFDYHFGVPSNHGDLTGVYVENRFVYGLRSAGIPPTSRKHEKERGKNGPYSRSGCAPQKKRARHESPHRQSRGVD
jgi:hypothetical protein